MQPPGALPTHVVGMLITGCEFWNDLHKRLPSATTAQDKMVIQRQLDATDNQIDRVVYQLCDLTDEEIKIVEEATR